MTLNFETPISEESVQTALVDLLSTCDSARAALLSRLGAAHLHAGRGGTFVSAARSVRGGNGESDIVVEWSVDGNGRLRVLIEVKLTAGFMKRQGARYQERAATIAEGQHGLKVVCVLVAPASYLASANPEAAKFDHHLPLEFFVENSPTTSPGIQVIASALPRIAADKPLGAKGLFPNLHHALHSECERRALCSTA